MGPTPITSRRVLTVQVTTFANFLHIHGVGAGGRGVQWVGGIDVRLGVSHACVAFYIGCAAQEWIELGAAIPGGGMGRVLGSPPATSVSNPKNANKRRFQVQTSRPKC